MNRLAREIIDVLFPFNVGYRYLPSEYLFEENLFSLRPLMSRLSTEQRQFFHQAQMKTLSENTQRKVLLQLMQSCDSLETLLFKYNFFKNKICWDKKGLVNFNFKTLEFPTDRFQELHSQLNDYFSNDAHTLSKILCLWAKDREMWPLIHRNVFNGCFTLKLNVKMIGLMISICETKQHYEELSQFIYHELPLNFTKRAKHPFKCVKRNLVPLIKKLTTLETIRIAKENLHYYKSNFHTIKNFHHRRGNHRSIIMVINDLHNADFVNIWRTKINKIKSTNKNSNT